MCEAPAPICRSPQRSEMPGTHSTPKQILYRYRICLKDCLMRLELAFIVSVHTISLSFRCFLNIFLPGYQVTFIWVYVDKLIFVFYLYSCGIRYRYLTKFSRLKFSPKADRVEGKESIMRILILFSGQFSACS